jgi:hypothetical protein
MNKAAAKKLVWKSVKLRPVAIELSPAGNAHPVRDDKWLVVLVDDKAGIRLHNQRTHHGEIFPWDHFLEYRTDASGETAGILILKSQVFLQGNDLRLEPLSWHAVQALTGPPQII